MNKTLESLAPYFLSLLRIVAGLIFMEHGTGKLLGFPTLPHPPGLLSLPWIAGIFELIGGALVAAGFYTRLAAFIISGEMAVAYFLVFFPRSFFPVLSGGDAAVLYCFVFLYLVFAGPGPLSVDARRG